MYLLTLCLFVERRLITLCISVITCVDGLFVGAVDLHTVDNNRWCCVWYCAVVLFPARFLPLLRHSGHSVRLYLFSALSADWIFLTAVISLLRNQCGLRSLYLRDADRSTETSQSLEITSRLECLSRCALAVTFATRCSGQTLACIRLGIYVNACWWLTGWRYSWHVCLSVCLCPSHASHRV